MVMQKKPLRPVYMVFPGIYALLMINYWIYDAGMPAVGIMVSKSNGKHKGRFMLLPEALYRLFLQSGFHYMFYLLMIAKCGLQIITLSNFFKRLFKKPVRIKTFAQIYREKNIPVCWCVNFNGEEAHAFMKKVNANCIVSAYNNQILKRKTLELFPGGAIGVHNSYFPEYGGLDGTFEALYDQATHSGATTFLIDKTIDTGNIISQKKIAIHKDDSLFSLNVRLWILGALLLPDVLRAWENDSIQSKEQDPEAVRKCYNSYPLKKKVDEYIKRGGKLVTKKDIFCLWSEVFPGVE